MTTTAISPKEWQEAKDRVLSWIQDEQRCVTAQRIHQEINGFSKRDGSRLLEEISATDASFQTTTCRKRKQGHTTVFRLHSSTQKQVDDSTIFALASLQATESIATAHERDMVQFRENIQTNQVTHSILPADEIVALPEAKRAKATAVETTNASTATTATTSSTSKHHPFAGKTKAVTAASFFAKNGNKKKTEKNSNKKKTEKSSREVKPTAEKENKTNSNSKNKTVKPSNGNGNKTIGNADDFVADEEESDDDEVVVAEKTAPRRRMPEPEEDEVAEVETRKERKSKPPPSPVRGAMDAFATEAPAKPTNNDIHTHKRKRRQKMVETTTMVNGYLRTETQVVWEEIGSDEEQQEEEQQRQKAAAKKSKPTSSRPAAKKGAAGQEMKQKTLMGFFSKK